jgi:hypothetical protein
MPPKMGVTCKTEDMDVGKAGLMALSFPCLALFFPTTLALWIWVAFWWRVGLLYSRYLRLPTNPNLSLITQYCSLGSSASLAAIAWPAGLHVVVARPASTATSPLPASPPSLGSNDGDSISTHPLSHVRAAVLVTPSNSIPPSTCATLVRPTTTRCHASSAHYLVTTVSALPRRHHHLRPPAAHVLGAVTINITFRLDVRFGSLTRPLLGT